MALYGEITIAGLYEADNTIFDNWDMPSITIEGVTYTVDKTVLISNLVDELDDFEVLPADSDKIKVLIGNWSDKMIDIWNRLYMALKEDYNPLHNYDRTETHDETESAKNTTNSMDTSRGSNNNQVVGYNSTSLADASKVSTSMTGQARSDSDNQIIRNYTIRAFGNIGVTTSQQMLEAEMQLRQKYNIYDLLIMDFKDRFCLPVY